MRKLHKSWELSDCIWRPHYQMKVMFAKKEEIWKLYIQQLFGEMEDKNAR